MDKKIDTTLGVDAVYAQLALSEKKALKTFAQANPSHYQMYSGEEPYYAYCYDTDASFENKEQLFYYICERVRLTMNLPENFEVFAHLPISGDFINLNYERDNFIHICPITGSIDLGCVKLFAKNLSMAIEYGQLSTALSMFRFIAILQEDLADFLQFFITNIYRITTVHVHVETTPLEGITRTKIIS